MRKNTIQIEALILFLWTLNFNVNAFDHVYQNWNQVLEKNVSHARVNYEGLKKEPGDLINFLEEIANLSQTELNGFTEKEQLAFWINVYNATTVKLVVDNYPPKRDFGIGAIRYPEHSLRQVEDAFERESALVAGKKMSLNHIEHEILRKKFNEPRIHFALVCAAVSCPPLRGEPYRSQDLNQQLADQGFVFINDPSKNSYSEKDQTLYLSKIFEWFGEDFSPPGVQKFVKKFLPDSQQNQITSKTKIKWLPYDWTLNSQK